MESIFEIESSSFPRRRGDTHSKKKKKSPEKSRLQENEAENVVIIASFMNVVLARRHSALIKMAERRLKRGGCG